MVRALIDQDKFQLCHLNIEIICTLDNYCLITKARVNFKRNFCLSLVMQASIFVWFKKVVYIENSDLKTVSNERSCNFTFYTYRWNTLCTLGPCEIHVTIFDYIHLHFFSFVYYLKWISLEILEQGI